MQVTMDIADKTCNILQTADLPPIYDTYLYLSYGRRLFCSSYSRFTEKPAPQLRRPRHLLFENWVTPCTIPLFLSFFLSDQIPTWKNMCIPAEQGQFEEPPSC